MSKASYPWPWLTKKNSKRAKAVKYKNQNAKMIAQIFNTEKLQIGSTLTLNKGSCTLEKFVCKNISDSSMLQ
jgi:hypothetical protein